MRWLQNFIQSNWQKKRFVSNLLLPLSWIFCFVVAMRRLAYRKGLLKSRSFGVPLIVVGNIYVGGTGKTPLVIWLALLLTKAGYRPGIVSRGYGGKAKVWPQSVEAVSDPGLVGDEAVMIARRTDCPMQVGPNRVHAVQALLHHQSCDVIISDDGLQHYAMARDLEILVVDGQRRFGNGRCLPAGPLREPPARQWEVDFRVTNGTPEEGEHGIQSRGDVLCNLADAGQKLRFDAWAGKSVHGVCGIGNPQRFFDWLRQKGLNPVEHAFPDHYDYRSEDLEFGDDLPVIMTEKDAVKCQGFANARHWYAPIALETNQALALQILTRLKEVVKQNG